MGEVSGVGASAAQQAQRSAQRAAAAADRAQRAADRAQAFAKGEEGERAAAAVLDTLGGYGFVLLHDRVVPPLAGNVDHVVVGPGGVWVFNTKNWRYPPRLRGSALYAGTNPQHKTLERCRRERDAVSALLHTAGIDVTGSVRTGLLLVGGVDRSTPDRVGDVQVVPLGDVVRQLSAAPPTLSPPVVAAVADTLAASCPSATAVVALPPPTLSEFDQSAAAGGMPPASRMSDVYRRRYVRAWRRCVAHRLDVFDDAGALLASKDVTSQQVTFAPGVERRSLTGAMVEQMTAKGVGEVALPAVTAGSGLRRIAYGMVNVKVSVLAGWHWSRGDLERLYVHLLSPGERAVQIGHIDLSTGTSHSKLSGPLPGRTSTAQHLLRWVHMGYVPPGG